MLYSPEKLTLPIQTLDYPASGGLHARFPTDLEVARAGLPAHYPSSSDFNVSTLWIGSAGSACREQEGRSEEISAKYATGAERNSRSSSSTRERAGWSTSPGKRSR